MDFELNMDHQLEADIADATGVAPQVSFEDPNQLGGEEDPELALIHLLASQVIYAGGAAPCGLETNGPAACAEVDHLVGTTLIGRIKSVGDQFCFINSEHFPGDLFMHKTSHADNGPIGAGDPVQFEIAPDVSSGGCHAVNVHVMKEDVTQLVGQTVVGWVKSFKDTWGHINSNRFNGDVFLGLKANKHLVGVASLTKGVHVEFTVAPSHKGAAGMQALNVKVLGGIGTGGMEAVAGVAALPGMTQLGAAAPNPEALAAVQMMGVGGVGGVMAGMRPEAFVGCRLEGMIRRFKDNWGFIVSPSFEGDLFVHRGSSPNLGSLSTGDAVCFDIAQQSSGKCHAINVQPAGMAASLGVTRNSPLASLEGQRVTGQIRSFTGSWGFATSACFAGDIFIGSKSNPHLGPLNPGDSVEFTVSRSSGGKSMTGFEGINVQVVGSESAGLMDSTTLGDAGAMAGMTGTTADNLAMMNAAAQANQALLMQGVGVSGLAGVTGVAGGNLNMMGTAAAGTGRSRSPRFSSTRTGGDTGRQAASLAGAAVTGWIKSFKGDWGFVNSQNFDGDLFIGLRSNPHLPGVLSAGDQVMFQISVGPGGKAEAINVQALETGAAAVAGIGLQESQTQEANGTSAAPLQ